MTYSVYENCSGTPTSALPHGKHQMRYQVNHQQIDDDLDCDYGSGKIAQHDIVSLQDELNQADNEYKGHRDEIGQREEENGLLIQKVIIEKRQRKQEQRSQQFKKSQEKELIALLNIQVSELESKVKDLRLENIRIEASGIRDVMDNDGSLVSLEDMYSFTMWEKALLALPVMLSIAVTASRF